jgi:hypothetical protein
LGGLSVEEDVWLEICTGLRYVKAGRTRSGARERGAKT